MGCLVAATEPCWASLIKMKRNQREALLLGGLSYGIKVGFQRKLVLETISNPWQLWAIAAEIQKPLECCLVLAQVSSVVSSLPSVQISKSESDLKP